MGAWVALAREISVLPRGTRNRVLYAEAAAGLRHSRAPKAELGNILFGRELAPDECHRGTGDGEGAGMKGWRRLERAGESREGNPESSGIQGARSHSLRPRALQYHGSEIQESVDIQHRVGLEMDLTVELNILYRGGTDDAQQPIGGDNVCRIVAGRQIHSKMGGNTTCQQARRRDAGFQHFDGALRE